MVITVVSLIGQTLISDTQPRVCFAILLTQKVPQVLGWVAAWAGDVQERGWSRALLLLSPRLPALLRVGTASLASRCLQDLL